MKHLFLLLLILPLPGRGQAMEHTPVEPTSYLEKSVWRITALAPGVLNETRLGRQTTVVTSAQLSGVSVNSGLSLTGGFSATTYINSYLSVGSRYFYNIHRRADQGKAIRSNSANYLMIRANYTFQPFTLEYEPRNTIGVLEGVSVNALWGLQRTFQDNIYLNFATGVKVAPNGFGLAGNFILGYTLPSKRQVQQRAFSN